jgi:hypothetical protein
MKLTDIKSNADLHKFVKSFYEAQATALNGLMDKLPEGLRTELKTLHDSINDSLKALPPLEQVPAANDAAWALNCFTDAMVRMQEYASGLMEKINSIKNELNAKATALNSLQGQVSQGDLVTRERLKELCDLARGEGASSLKPELIATRKGALELAGLPVPSEDVLALPAEQYQSRLNAAKDHLQKLTAKGLKLGGKGDGFVRQTAWLGATEFNGQISVLDDIIPAAPKADPLLGNAAPAPAAEAKTNVPVITLA